jgi:pyruvate formate lyase activating enzyme
MPHKTPEETLGQSQFSKGRTRRAFLAWMGWLGLNAALAPAVLKTLEGLGGIESGALAAPPPKTSVPALYWRPLPGGQVQCLLCPRQEVLAPGQMGFCRARQNLRGTLVTHAYGRPCVLNLDPVEMNPLNHFQPGMQVLAVAHAGCNLRCLYCQNWQFSQKSPLETRNIVPFDFRQMGEKMRYRRVGGVSFTYTEADCAPEFATDFAQFCGELGLKRTLCTAGYIDKQALRELLRHFEAVTITYKGATDSFYRRVIQGSLAPVLEAMVTAKSEGKWLEVATLIVPTLNDRREHITTMARWIRQNLGPDTPWHLERFDPQYKLAHLPPTPQATLETARQIGLETGLKFVYISNLAPHLGNHTYCPSCGRTLVRRLGFKVLEKRLARGRCPACRTLIPGVWA